MNCIEPGCMNWLHKKPLGKLHRLPKDPQLLKKWLHVLKRKDVPARASRICRRHFAEADFAMKGTFDAATGSFRMERSRMPTLKPSACASMPTLNPSACASIRHFEGYGVGVTDRPSSPHCRQGKATERRRRRESMQWSQSYHILGNAGLSLQQDFYTIEGLAEQIIGSALISLDNVPDHRLRPMLRVFLKQLVLSCPPEYYDSLLCPLLGPLFAYMLQRLNIRWQIINQRSTVSMEEDEDEVCEEKQVTQEMLEEQLVRLVTREVLDLLTHACILKKVPEPAGNKEDVDDEEMMSTESQAVTANPAQPTGEMTELGKCLLKHEDIYMTLLTISFTSLSWKDTSNCHRTASMVCWTLLRQVVGGNLLPEAVTWFYASVLKGLQMHGQHEVCNSALTQLALVIYENLRPRYLELRSVMTQIPSINLEALDQYDQRLLEPSSAQKVGEKKRKDQFKKLISGTVGKALGQQFKKEVHIRNLPSLFKKPKPEKRDIVEPSESGALAALFSPTRDNI